MCPDLGLALGLAGFVMALDSADLELTFLVLGCDLTWFSPQMRTCSAFALTGLDLTLFYLCFPLCLNCLVAERWEWFFVNLLHNFKVFKTASISTKMDDISPLHFCCTKIPDVIFKARISAAAIGWSFCSCACLTR